MTCPECGSPDTRCVSTRACPGYGTVRVRECLCGVELTTREKVIGVKLPRAATADQGQLPLAAGDRRFPHTPSGSGSSPDLDPDPLKASSPKVVRKSRDVEPAEFRDWYAAYPRHEARRDAFKAWQQTERSRPPISALLAALAWQKHTPAWTKDRGQFIPLPATYLRGGRWADERPGTNGHTSTPRGPQFIPGAGAVDEPMPDWMDDAMEASAK